MLSVLEESVQRIKEGTEARVVQGGPGGGVALELGFHGQELALLEQRLGVGLLGLEWLSCPFPLPLPELCPPGLSLSPPHSLPLPPAVWSSYWITVQTPPCGTGRATQLCTMQPPMATDRTSNWYVWDLPRDRGGRGRVHSLLLCLWILEPRDD